jgi:Fic family protein
LLITFLLCEKKILERPLLYLSHYLKMHRAQYYDRLTAIRQDGDWEGWLKFFLQGVSEVSQEATATARLILKMREEHRQMMRDNANALQLLDYLFQYPILKARMVADHLACSYPTANQLLKQLEQAGLVEEMTGWQRNRRYRYRPYLNLFESQEGVLDVPDIDVEVQAT